MAGRHLAGPDGTARAVGIAQQHLGVVVDGPAGHEAAELGAQLGQRLARHVIRQVPGMRADVANRAAAGLGRVGAPGGLLVAAAFQRLGQPVLRVFGLHHADVAQPALQHHLPRHAHHRVGAVVVGDGEDQALLLRQRGELLRIGAGGGDGLVADDVDAGLQKRRGRRGVQVVGRDDGHGLDAVFTRGFGLRHGLEAVVGARRVQAQCQARAARLFGRGRQCAGHQFVLVVQPRGDAVHAADEGAFTAAHHAQADARRLGGGRCDRGLLLGRHLNQFPACGAAAPGPSCRPRSRRRLSR